MTNTKPLKISTLPYLADCPRCLWNHENEDIYISKIHATHIICPMTKKRVFLSEIMKPPQQP